MECEVQLLPVSLNVLVSQTALNRVLEVWLDPVQVACVSIGGRVHHVDVEEQVPGHVIKTGLEEADETVEDLSGQAFPVLEEDLQETVFY